jgi:hypothetical protein
VLETDQPAQELPPRTEARPLEMPRIVHGDWSRQTEQQQQ